jgi:hypothetical protein
MPDGRCEVLKNISRLNLLRPVHRGGHSFHCRKRTIPSSYHSRHLAVETRNKARDLERSFSYAEQRVCLGSPCAGLQY